MIRLQLGVVVAALLLLLAASVARCQPSLNDFMSTKALYSPAIVPIGRIDPVSQCIPRQLSMVLRHGTRAPTKTDIAAMKNLRAQILENIANVTNAPLAAAVRSWQVENGVTSDMLTPVGAEEHYRIGQRLRAKYAPLFQRPYTPARYRFRSTSVPRAARSAQSLAFGVFEKDGVVGGANGTAFLPVFVDMVARADDHLLRFFKTCPAYAAYAEQCCDGKDAMIERLIAPVAHELSQQLAGDGQPIRWQLNSTHADAIYTACQFENAEHRPPLWCPLLSRQALAAFEFVDDVMRERGGARGNPAHDCAADLVRAMRDSLVACASDDGECATPVSLWFAHAETIIPLSSALHLFETRPMLEWTDQPPSPSALSSWPVSQVSPFAANIGFVLYECANNATPDARWMVQALHNEAPIQMRNASDTVTLADWLSPQLYGDLLLVNTTERCYLPANATPSHTHVNDISSLTGTGLIVVACVAATGFVFCVIAAVCALTSRNRSIRSDKSGQFKTSYSKEKETEQLARRFSDINAPFRLRTRTATAPPPPVSLTAPPPVARGRVTDPLLSGDGNAPPTRDLMMDD